MEDTALSRFSKENLWGPFPYEDCRSLEPLDQTGQLIPDVDLFLADIAGFATTATILTERSREQLDYGLRSLNLGFFARFSKHAHLAAHITAESTPKLFAQLNAAEILRPQLLELLKQAKVNKHGKASPQ